MMHASPTHSNPISGGSRIGLIGLRRRGLHLLERLTLAGQASRILATDPDPTHCEAARPRVAVATDVTTLLAQSDVDRVCITLPLHERTDLVERCLAHGKDVWIEDSPALAHARAVELFRQAELRGRQLRVWRPRHPDSDFEAALAAAKSGRLGELHSLRWINAEWTILAGVTAPPFEIEPLLLQTTTALNHLLAIADRLPRRVNATLTGSGDGLWIQVEFALTLKAHLELNRRARVSLQTGWHVEGTDASYARNRLYSLTSDGELIDEPWRTESSPLELSAALMGTRPTDLSEMVTRECRVAGLVELIRKSLEQGREVHWEDLD